MAKHEFDKIKDKMSAVDFHAKKMQSRKVSLAKSRKMQQASNKKIPSENLSDTSSECSFSSISTETSSKSSSSSSLFKKRWNSDTAHYEKERTARPAEHSNGISKEELMKQCLKGR